MAHNFKLTGDYYVSVDGSDSNNGLTKDTPKRTIQATLNALVAGATRTIIIGSGVYKENISYIIGGGTLPVNMIADGYVVFEALGLGANSIVLGSGSSPGHTFTITGVEFRNMTSIRVQAGGSTGATINFINCIIKCDCFLASLVGGSIATLTFSNSVILNSRMLYSGGSHILTFNKCILINSNTGDNFRLTTFTNSYANSTTTLGAASGITTVNFNYNNIQGSIVMNVASSVTSGIIQDIYGRYYDLSITTSTGSGTIGDPYGRPYTSGTAFSFNSHRTAYPTYNVNSFALDPKFNNILAQDFTLQADSPHIGKAQNGIDNIGETRYAIRHSAKGDAFNISAVSVTDLNFAADDYVITSPSTSGEVISAPMLVSSTSKVLQKITYNGLFEFNKLISGGSVGNRNVPDQDVYASSSQPPNVAGANPDRLVYYMRYSTQSTQPTTNSEWDNGGYWTAGNYGIFEWNTKPSIDNAFLGNGDPAFNSAATPTFLNVTWIQLKVKLRNNYA